MKKFNLLMLLLFITSAFGAVAAHAQDVIVKTDKTEIKSKVLEITDTQIKYKKFEMLDGPTYNISKSDVFMIIYKNGQKEIISKAPQPPVTTAAPAPVYGAPQVKAPDNTTETIDYQSLPIRYSPVRLMYTSISSDGSSAGALGVQLSYRVIKNYVNVGADVHYYISGVGDGLSMTEGALYIEPYLGLNRALGDYEHQNQGLFINAKIGGGFNEVKDNSTDQSVDTGGLFLGIGADYFFSNSFGISVGTYKLKDFTQALQIGITAKL